MCLSPRNEAATSVCIHVMSEYWKHEFLTEKIHVDDYHPALHSPCSPTSSSRSPSQLMQEKQQFANV